jgi:hypothetical protein
MVARVETHQIHGAEDGCAGTTDGLVDDGVDLVDLHALVEHDANRVGHVEHADTVADEIGNVLANHHAFAQVLLTELDHEIHHRRIRFGAGDDSMSFI